MKTAAEIREQLVKARADLDKLNGRIRAHLNGTSSARISIDFARQRQYALGARIKALAWVLGIDA